MNYVKSPLNYTGGKFKLLDQIVPLFPKNIGTFVDSFGGGGNVFPNVKAEKYIYNDFNASVAGLLYWVYSTETEMALAQVDRYISQYSLCKENQEGYLKCREDYNSGYGKEAPHLYALLTHSFNNQIRFNGKGHYNMPFGKGRSSFNPMLRRRFEDFSDKLRPLLLGVFCDSFENMPIDSDAFVYCDPPYLISTATYNEKNGWGKDQERQLLGYLDSLNDKGVRFALSNVTHHIGMVNTLLTEFADRYNVHELNISYSNSSYHKKDRESKSREVLITNY